MIFIPLKGEDVEQSWAIGIIYSSELNEGNLAQTELLRLSALPPEINIEKISITPIFKGGGKSVAILKVKKTTKSMLLYSARFQESRMVEGFWVIDLDPVDKVH